MLRYKNEAPLKPSQDPLVRHGLQVEVLSACTALRMVGVEVLFSQNKFDFHETFVTKASYPCRVDQWLATIGPINIGLIISLAFSYMFRLSGRTTYLRGSQGHFGTLLRDAHKLYSLALDFPNILGISETNFID